MIKAVLFDFDGTLIDSMPSFINVMLKILDEFLSCYLIDNTPIIVA